MRNSTLPASPGDLDPRHVFLTAKEVIVRYGWGRTYGYEMLRSTGLPRRIGDRFRLDSLIAWEQAVLAGELSDDPEEPVTATASAAAPAAAKPDGELVLLRDGGSRRWLGRPTSPDGHSRLNLPRAPRRASHRQPRRHVLTAPA